MDELNYTGKSFLEKNIYKQAEIKCSVEELIETCHLDEAEKLLLELGRICEMKSGYYSIKAKIEIAGTKFEAALDTVQNGLFKYPESFDLLYLLGSIYERQGNFLEANDAYVRALKHAENERDKNLAEDCVFRMADIIKSIPYTKADYAKSLNKVVSVYCYGRSGTHFFKSLLDSHPDTIVTMLNGIKILNLWENAVKDKGSGLSYEYAVEKIFEVLHTEFNDGREYDEPKLNGMYAMGENRDKYYCIDKVRFKQEFISIMEEGGSPDARFFYQAVQLAASYALGRSYDFTKGIPVIIEGGIHFSTYTNLTQQLLDVFPYTRLIHMVRNPVASVASTVRSLAKSGIGDINLLCSNLVILLHRVPENAYWVDRTCLVKLEDLHTKPRETLQLVCEHLGISWNDSLMESTFGGIKWWNTTTSEVVSGFNTIIISKTQNDVMSSFDKFRFECLLRFKYKAWRYDSFDFYDYDIMKKLLEYPFKFEELYSKSHKEYILNRKIIYRSLLKYLKEENDLAKGQRYEHEVKLLSPETG